MTDAEANDPQHWLYRLTAKEWLVAAENELRLCDTALQNKAYRTGVTHARRAAGMALNSVLCHRFAESWGRSYMDHLNALPGDPSVPTEISDAARILVITPARAPELVTLGKADVTSLAAATSILQWAQTFEHTT